MNDASKYIFRGVKTTGKKKVSSSPKKMHQVPDVLEHMQRQEEVLEDQDLQLVSQRNQRKTY